MRMMGEKKKMRIYGALIRTVKGPSPNHSNACLGHVGEGVRDVVVRVQVWQPIRVCPYKLEIPGDIKGEYGRYSESDK
jgi:hypothetical protein